MGDLRGITLALDTCVGDGSLSLWRDEEEVFSAQSLRSGAKGLDVLQKLDDALAQENMRFGDVDRVLMTIGPGSYTGIRMGIATVMGLGGSSEFEISTCTVFEAFSSAVPDADSLCAAVIKAGRTELAVSFLDLDEDRNRIVVREGHRFVPLAELPKMCRDGERNLLIVESGSIDAVQDMIESDGNSNKVKIVSTGPDVSRLVFHFFLRAGSARVCVSTPVAFYTREFSLGK